MKLNAMPEVPGTMARQESRPAGGQQQPCGRGGRSPSRSLALGLVLGLTLLCGVGCRVKEDALLVSRTLQSSSQSFNDYVQRLQGLDAARVEALRVTRSSLLSALQEQQAMLSAVQGLRFELNHQDVFQRLNAKHVATLIELRRRRTEAEATLGETIEAALSELTKEEERLKLVAQQTEGALNENPNDQDRLAAYHVAVREYAIAAVINREYQMEIRRRALESMGPVDERAYAALEDKVEAIRAEMQAAVEVGRKDLELQGMTPIVLPEAPESGEEMFKPLLEYGASVKQAGAALENYVRVSSLSGQGSLVDSLLTSFQRGLGSSALPASGEVGEVQLPDAADVVLGGVLGGLEARLGAQLNAILARGEKELDRLVEAYADEVEVTAKETSKDEAARIKKRGP